MNKLTLEDVDKFYGYARKWQDLLQLGRWRLARSEKRSNMMAEVKFDSDPSHKLARLLVGSDWKSTPPTDENLEMTALHEVLHVFLKELVDTCSDFPTDSTKKMEREHEVIIVLERLLYELWNCNHVEFSEELPVHRPENKGTKPH